MTYSFNARIGVLVSVLVSVSIFCSISGNADEEVPQTGTGFVGNDPAEIVARALLCFNEKSIYSSCEESCRLTESGNLNVAPGQVNSYCEGPCIEETHLVLNCIESVMLNFEFYNRATIPDIRETVKAGCGYGPERGNFNVAEHIQAEGGSAYKTANKILIGLGFLLGARVLF